MHQFRFSFGQVDAKRPRTSNADPWTRSALHVPDIDPPSPDAGIVDFGETFWT